MYGPYPAYASAIGFVEPITRDMFWLYAASTDDDGSWSVTIARHSFDEGTITLTTCSGMPGTGAPSGRLLVDADNFYVSFFTGAARLRWYKISRSDGSLLGFIGNFSEFGNDSAAYLDGNGYLISIAETTVYVFAIDDMNLDGLGGAIGTGTLPKPCQDPIGTAVVSDGLAWARCLDGTSAVFSLIDTTSPGAPTVTSFDLGYTIEADALVYSSARNELIFWKDNDTIIRWSTVAHSVVSTVTHSGGFTYMGPIAGRLFAVGLDLYDPISLNIALTANGYNPALPDWTNIGINFGHWYDGGGVIWLVADDGNVYGAVVQPSAGIPHGANCNNYPNGGALSPRFPPGNGFLLGEIV